MTRKEFLEKLAETPRDWFFVHSSASRKLIRRPCVGRLIDVHNSQCPLTSLINQPADDYFKAGQQLKLNSREAERIWKTADDWKGSEYFDEELRKQMLAACGLKEEKE